MKELNLGIWQFIGFNFFVKRDRIYNNIAKYLSPLKKYCETSFAGIRKIIPAGLLGSNLTI